MLAVGVALWAQAAPVGGRRQDFFLAILLGGTVLFLTGLIDDALGMRAGVKLGLQAVAASATYFVGQRIDVLTFGPHTSVSVAWISFPLTVLWIVGVTNAFNLIDGLDGLATGIGLVVLATVAAAATVLHNADVVLVCVALIGALLGFLRFNLTPARLFLGDSGSLFVGYMLAMLSLHGSLKGATGVVIAVPVCALAVPLLDVALAVARRWLRGDPIFGADARHLHHRLLAAGLRPSGAAIMLCALAAGFAIYGLGLAFAPPPAVLTISLVGGAGALALVLSGIRRLNYHEITEASAVLASGLKRVRRVMRDQIHSREIAELVPRVPSLAALNGMLASRSAQFGFIGMEVGREHAIAGRANPYRTPAGGQVRAWRLDFPVTPAEQDDEEPFILRITCDHVNGYRPFAAERVARIVGAAVEDWIRATGATSAIDMVEAEAPVLAAVGADERLVDPAVVRDGAVPVRPARRLGTYDRRGSLGASLAAERLVS